MTKNNLIYLRGHHLLCLQGYQGYGYDERFKKNMDRIFNILNINNANINNSSYKNKYKIVLTDYPDDLCVCCPKLKENKCIGEIDSLYSSKNNNSEDNNTNTNNTTTNNSDTNNSDKNNDNDDDIDNNRYNKDYKDNINRNNINNDRKISLNNNKIIEMDKIVLKKAKLEKNREYCAEEVISAVNNVFSNIKSAKEVCGTCKWENKCLWIQSREN